MKSMNGKRLEAFSDGVMAIIITIMILEIKAPDGASLEDLKPLLNKFTAYILSFIYVGIYWNNHHHLWQAVERVNGKILWANLHLLFWLSLFPFSTAWMGEHYTSSIPVAVYGFILFMASVAWYILALLVIKEEGKESKVGQAYQRDTKTKISMLIYASATVIAVYKPLVSMIIYALLAAVWFIPDKRIESKLAKNSPNTF
jgi:uncharacterized membrane protein